MLLTVASRSAARHVAMPNAHRLISRLALSPAPATRVVPAGFRAVVAAFSRTYAATAKAATKKATGTKKATAAAASAKTTAKKSAATKKKTAAGTKKAAAKKAAKPKKTAAKPKAAKKPGRKPKKPLSERQVALLQKKKIAELKKVALLKSPVTKLPESTFTVFFTEKKDQYFPKDQKPNAIEALGKARSDFKTLSAAEIERLEAKVKTNRAANEAAHKKWLASLEPQEIYDAQRARMELSRKGVSLNSRKLPALDDDRIPKQPLVAWLRWLQANYEQFRGIQPTTERVRKAGAIWRELSPEDRKPFEDSYQEDLAAYLKEMESLRKHPHRPSPSP
ncbi:hypothetical protein VTJ83DRAFT_1996 [Remersonia thermophila]|uniref:HMG box domain-containing protein n=1 Tax=Remersonia thermophila TaxID=72144 RepID=A0ABR4DHH3_9PEZI